MVNNKQSWAEFLNQIVKTFFNKYLPSFYLENEQSYGPYWGVQYKDDAVIITIGGDIGFEIKVTIDNKEYSLWQFDRSVNNYMETNERNILYQLEVLKRFLKENRS